MIIFTVNNPALIALQGKGLEFGKYLKYRAPEPKNAQ